MSDAVNLDALEALAQAATPGPWYWKDDEMVTDAIGDDEDADWDFKTGSHVGPTTLIKTDSGQYPPRANNAAFIAAANPATVLALIARLRATEALVERAFSEGFAAGVDAREWRDFDSAMDRQDGKWRRSDAKAALAKLREGA